MKTQIRFPLITFNHTFKTNKQAKQAAIKALMGCIEDKDILKAFKVKKVRNDQKRKT
jgi:hypothetical protein